MAIMYLAEQSCHAHWISLLPKHLSSTVQYYNKRYTLTVTQSEETTRRTEIRASASPTSSRRIKLPNGHTIHTARKIYNRRQNLTKGNYHNFRNVQVLQSLKHPHSPFCQSDIFSYLVWQTVSKPFCRTWIRPFGLVTCAHAQIGRGCSQEAARVSQGYRARWDRVATAFHLVPINPVFYRSSLSHQDVSWILQRYTR